MRFGRQRSGTDIAAIVLLFAGFCGLAYAIWAYLGNRFGVLLPIGFLIGMYASLRIEVREIEIRADTLIIRTFFRMYPIPRAHVTNVALTGDGASIDVLNGRRYLITPPDVDPETLAKALAEWLREGQAEIADPGAQRDQ